jgi:hypothetical protein
MKCPDCGRSTTRGKTEKIRVLSEPETFEIDVIVISCIHCKRTLGVVSVPLRLKDILITQPNSSRS